MAKSSQHTPESLVDRLLQEAADRLARQEATASSHAASDEEVSAAVGLIRGPYGAGPDEEAVRAMAARAFGSAIAVVALDGPHRKAARVLEALRAAGASEPDEDDVTDDAPLYAVFDVGSGSVEGDGIHRGRLVAVARVAMAALEARPEVGALLAVSRGNIGVTGIQGDAVDEAMAGAHDLAPGRLTLSPLARRCLDQATDLGFDPSGLDGHAGEQPTLRDGILAWIRRAVPGMGAPTLGVWVHRVARGHTARHRPPSPRGYSRNDQLHLRFDVPEGHNAWVLLHTEAGIHDATPSHRPWPPGRGRTVEHTLGAPGSRQARPVLLLSTSDIQDLGDHLARINERLGAKGEPQPLPALFKSLSKGYPEGTLALLAPEVPFESDPVPEPSPDLSAARDAIRAGRYKEAERLAEGAATAAGVAADHLQALVTLGVALRSQGRFDEALGRLERAYDEARELAELAIAADARREMARIVLARGFPSLALSHVREAISLHRQARDREEEAKDRLVEGEALWLLGYIEAAIGAYGMAVEAGGASANPRIEGAALQGMGILRIDLGDFERAEQDLRNAIRVFETSGDPANHGRAVGALGTLYLEKGEASRAAECFEHQLRLIPSDGLSEERTNALVSLAMARVDLGAFDAAQAAIDRLRDSDEHGAVAGLGRVHLSVPIIEAQIQLGRGDAAAAQARSRDALAGYAELVPEQIRRAALTFALATERLGGDPAPCYEEGIRAMEALRASLTRERRTRILDTQRPLIDALVDHLDRTDQVDALRRALARTRSRTFLETLEAQDGLQGGHESADRIAPWAQGTALGYAELPDGVVAVEIYCLRDRALLVVTDRAGTTRRHLSIARFAIERQAGLLRAACERPTGRGWAEPAWRTLSDVLLAPLRDVITRPGVDVLTFIPDRSLANVPLHALPFGDDDAPLLETVPVAYAPSLPALALWSRRPGTPRQGGVVAFADVRGDLPGARREVSVLERALGLQATVLVGAEANFVQLVRRSPDARILHLAVHAGKAERLEPAWLDLAPAPPGALGDLEPELEEPALSGRVGVEAIARLRTSADLVVLSACESGAGRLTPAGEGPDLLSWAFLSAGARSVIASSWPLADASGEKLLSAFYASWASGDSKVRALARAQQSLRDEARRLGADGTIPAQDVAVPAHPYYWAGLTLMGDWR